MTRTVLFDLDGTLVQPQGGIHPQDIRLLCSEQPYWFIPATGRPLHSTRALLAESGLFIDQKLPLPLIQQNGAALYRPYEELLDHTDLPEAALKALAERLAAARQVTVLFLGIETIAAALSEPRDAIEEVIEPYLLQQGLIQRTPRGRMLTQGAWRHLGLDPPRGQADLFD